MTVDGTILVTGGAGFIGSAVVRLLIRDTEATVVNIDKLTYAANPLALENAAKNPRYRFEQADISDAEAMGRIFAEHRPTAVMHLAAESHVDRSVDGPAPFVETNVVGTYVLLEAARAYVQILDAGASKAFRFHHVSTDEVFGSLDDGGLFTETTPYAPNSPYSATKASSDHLVRAWHKTYGLAVVISNCSNNYGPWQFPEKLVPMVITHALDGAEIPVYGKGENVRDWLHVEDHAEALVSVLQKGRLGECYNVGGDAEHANIDLVKMICGILDRFSPDDAGPRERLISFVADRPGHDLRYAMDASKIKDELGWTPGHDIVTGLEETVQWYLDHEDWWRAVRDEVYDGRRLGLGAGEEKG